MTSSEEGGLGFAEPCGFDHMLELIAEEPKMQLWKMTLRQSLSSKGSDETQQPIHEKTTQAKHYGVGNDQFQW